MCKICAFSITVEKHKHFGMHAKWTKANEMSKANTTVLKNITTGWF